ncbi:MAG TPA: hypothetical protein VHL77_11915 [Ferruginibacter sp.]|nr:hypothetical protein [Ferruginibacter sp.]
MGMRYDNELPLEYKSWLQLFRHLKKEGLVGEKEVQFSPMPRSYMDMSVKVRLYRFEVDFIKARCFDELKAPKFTVAEYEQIMYALINNRNIQRGDELDTKIKKAIDDLYEMGEY